MRSVCLVGAGFIADSHAEVLTGLAGTKITAVVDPSSAARERFARRWSIPATFSESSEAIAAGIADCAHILTPPNLHAAAAMPWLEAGVPVLIEKPVAATVEEADALVTAAGRSDVHGGVNHNFLHHPAFAGLEAALREGQLGPVRALHCSFNVPLRQLAAGQFGHWMFDRPFNLLLEQAVHPLSQVVGLAGEPTDFTARAGAFREISPGVRFYDSCTVLLETPLAPVTFQFRVGAAFPSWTLRALCDDGAGAADMLANRFYCERRGPWLDFVDAYVSNRRTAREIRRAGRQNAIDYVASLTKLRPRSDAFFKSMRGSVTEFHSALDDRREARSSLVFGRDLVTLCRSIADEAFPEAGGTAKAAVQVADPERVKEPDWDVAVLGGTGFIGRRVTAHLLDVGHTVAVMARSVRNLPELFAHPRVSLIRGDVRDREAIAAAVGEAGIVINLAHGGGGGSFEEIRDALVGSARAVAEVCLEKGVGRLVHVGSIAGLYLGDPGDVITAATPPDPHSEQRADYARAKALADAALLRMHRERGLPVVILRPGLVVGPGTSPFHSGLGAFNNEQHCIGWNRGDNPLPFVLVDDVAAAVEAAGRVPDIDGRCYNLVGGVRPSARAYIAELAKRTSRPLVFHGQAPRRLWAEEIAKWGVKKAVGRPAAWPYLRDIRSRGLAAAFDVSDAERDLGWRTVSDPDIFYDRCLATSAPDAPAEESPQAPASPRRKGAA